MLAAITAYIPEGIATFAIEDYIPEHAETMFEEYFCKKATRNVMGLASILFISIGARSGFEAAELYARGSTEIQLQAVQMVFSTACIACTSFFLIGLYKTRNKEVYDDVDVQLSGLYDQVQGEKRGKLEEVAQRLWKLLGEEDTPLNRHRCNHFVPFISAADFPLDALLQRLRDYNLEDERHNAEGIQYDDIQRVSRIRLTHISFFCRNYRNT